MVKIFLNGCCGRMGKAIANLCNNNPEYKIVAGGDIIENPNYDFPVYTSLNECTEDFLWFHKPCHCKRVARLYGEQ